MARKEWRFVSVIDEKPFELKQLDNNLNIVINYSETLRASKYQNFLHKLAFEKFGSVLPLLIINMHFLRFEHDEIWNALNLSDKSVVDLKFSCMSAEI